MISSVPRCLLLAFGVVATFGVPGLRALAAEPTPEQFESFEKQVRPILVERCYKCHSSRSEKLKGGLLLDSSAGVMKGGEGGPILVPGAPEKSRMVEAINYQNPDLQMPPKGMLPDKEIKILTEWVKLGAPWPPGSNAVTAVAADAATFDLEARRRSHWAWQPIRAVEPPPVTNNNLSAPDRFIVAKLEANQLEPAPEADKRVLIRRLTFDLTGLPPSPADVEAFVADTSPEAYEKLVDRLLASPRFGERWARHWLDLVRYSETLGHEFDYLLPNAWRYRDYVIRALNADVLYDQFVTEQVAGDLLDPPRINQKEGINESVIGTAFFWLGQREHSPVDVRQHQAEVIENQIDVLTKTFLGLTVACARCHDHKFDAIGTKDFYALYGVLEGSRYAQPAISLPSKTKPKIEKLQSLKSEIRRAAAAEWDEPTSQFAKHLMDAAREMPSEPATASEGESPAPTKISDPWYAAVAGKSANQSDHPMYAWVSLVRSNDSQQGNLQDRWKHLVSESKGNRVPATNEHVFAEANEGVFRGWFVEGDAFLHTATSNCDFLITPTNPAIVFIPQPAVNDAAVSCRLQGVVRSPSFVIRTRYAHVLAAGRASRIKVCVDNFTMIREPIYGGLLKRLDTNKLSWLTFDLEMWQGHRAFIELCDMTTPDTADEAPPAAFAPTGYIAASRVLFSNSANPHAPEESPAWLDLLGPEAPESLQQLAGRYQDALRDALGAWSSGNQPYSPRQRAGLALLEWMEENGLLDSPSPGELAKMIAQFRKLEASLEIPLRAPGMAEGNGADESIFIRGNPRTLGEPAPRQFLTALSNGRQSFRDGSGRLELAHCLTAPDNPLLARVMVNRVWLHLFGRGIVSTPDDFGVQGQAPTHPELLDWLANWYRTDAKWSTKRLIRLLVTTRAYRMSSAPLDRRAEERDPENLLFHRMNLKRLEGECIRDEMLAISGRLDTAMYGPSVGTHLTEFMEGRGRPSAQGPLDGAGRRTIYLEVRRNFPAPILRTFDTPVPLSTAGRRTVSNVPAQSLILMNDPFVAAQARLWAKRLMKTEDATGEARVARAWRMAFARNPDAEEQARVVAFGKQFVADASGDWWRQEQVWIELCHVIFNVKEFIFLQ